MGPHGLDASHEALLRNCTLIVGGKRLLAQVAGLDVPVMEITPFAEAITAIGQGVKNGSVAVLASGDPLFYGIGRRLLTEFGPDSVIIHPALSSMQEAFSRFKIPWDDARLVSLHGRRQEHLPGLLLAGTKTFAFTDQHNAPDILARKILAYLELIDDHALMSNCRIMVAENLGTDQERIYSGSLAEIAKQKFAGLNVFCMVCERKEGDGCLGLTEDEISHSRGLITKNEVRAITLHRLRLPRQGIFWDVGAGSGSISIEAARMNSGLTIYAIERKQEELKNIKENIRRYGCYNVIPVAGLAPEALQSLPAPERIFVGGSGGQLAEIIKIGAELLPHQGRLVVNGVIEKTITQAPALMREQGLTVDQTQVNITRTAENCESTVFNPIHIIVGEQNKA